MATVFTLPECCPVCGTKLVKSEEEAAVRCRTLNVLRRYSEASSTLLQRAQ
ncbi:MAG: hypothetical protein ACLTCP_02625 [Ruminococcus bicirculans (ex Wegman et al. 2014)]